MNQLFRIAEHRTLKIQTPSYSISSCFHTTQTFDQTALYFSKIFFIIVYLLFVKQSKTGQFFVSWTGHFLR